jgi:uncharacterized integral membrane protein
MNSALKPLFSPHSINRTFRKSHLHVSKIYIYFELQSSFNTNPMQTQNQQKPLHKASLMTRAFQGAGIALLLIILLLLQVRNPDPAWPKFWMIRPLIVVSCGGAMGGVVFYMMDQLRQQGGGKKILANILSLLLFVFILWLSFIFGLDGTLWD